MEVQLKAALDSQKDTSDTLSIASQKAEALQKKLSHLTESKEEQDKQLQVEKAKHYATRKAVVETCLLVGASCEETQEVEQLLSAIQLQYQTTMERLSQQGSSQLENIRLQKQVVDLTQ